MQRLTIETLGARGDGIARMDGQPVYIEGGLVGETVEAVLVTGRDGVRRGQIKSVITPSPDRQNPSCPHYDRCGGCVAQHMTREAYQSWKVNKTKSLIDSKHITPLAWDDPVFIAEGTRRRVTFKVVRQGKKICVGYHQRRSHNVVDVPLCSLPEPTIMALRETLMPYLLQMINDDKPRDVFIQSCDNGFDVCLTGKIGDKSDPDLRALETIAAIIRETAVIRFSWRLRDRDEPQVIVAQDNPIVAFGDLNVAVPPLAFLQPSYAGQAALSEALRHYLPDTLRKAADLFAGCGTFTGVLKEKGVIVDAYEGEGGAIRALQSAGHRQAYARDLFRDPLDARELADYDCIVIDPPRAGAQAQTACLAQSDVPHIIAVSCNPATFVRDAQMLIDGGYRIQRMRIVDQFIWSDHIELIALFSRP